MFAARDIAVPPERWATEAPARCGGGADAGAAPAACARFDIAAPDGAAWVEFPQGTVAEWVGVRFLSTHGDDSNIDVGAVHLYGPAGAAAAGGGGGRAAAPRPRTGRVLWHDGRRYPATIVPPRLRCTVYWEDGSRCDDIPAELCEYCG